MQGLDFFFQCFVLGEFSFEKLRCERCLGRNPIRCEQVRVTEFVGIFGKVADFDIAFLYERFDAVIDTA